MNMAHSTGAYNIRQVVESDWNAVSTVYRAMLTDAPTAFGETIQEIEQRTGADWKSLVAQWAQGSRAVAFIAEDAGGFCGFVRADTSDQRTPSGTVLVSNLWTAPRKRGQGLGRALMNAVEQWARERQAQRVALGVTEENHTAFGFYSALGYQDTGRRAPAGSDPHRTVSVLAKALTPATADRGTD
jgi:ribosomal protein S18 acetylase RimI-like enzyme